MADTQRPRPPPNRRRDKVQLSCEPCRHRKLRCDRSHPCGACSRRGLTHCNYATTSSSTLDAQRNLPQSTSLQGRISELESLVVTLMKGQSPSSPDVVTEIRRRKNPQGEAASPASDPGTLKMHESGTSSYVQSSHWEAVLTQIRGLKEDLVTDSKVPSGSHLFYGPNRHATRDEILAAVPARPVVDRLLALHFDSYIITPCQYIRAFFLLSEALTVCCRSHPWQEVSPRGGFVPRRKCRIRRSGSGRRGNLTFTQAPRCAELRCKISEPRKVLRLSALLTQCANRPIAERLFNPSSTCLPLLLILILPVRLQAV